MQVQTASTVIIRSPAIKPIITYILQSSTSERVGLAMKKRLLENLKEAQRPLKQLAESGSLKLIHFPLAIQTLFYSLVNEKLALLEKHHCLEEGLSQQWIEIKKIISSERLKSFYSPLLKHKLEEFSRHLEESLTNTKLDSLHFSQAMKNFNFLLSLQHIGDLAVCHFFADSFNEALRNNLVQISLPTSSAYQTIEFIIQVLRSEISWIAPHISEKIKQVMDSADDFLHTTSAEECEKIKKRLVGVLDMSTSILNIVALSDQLLAFLDAKKNTEDLVRQIESEIEKVSAIKHNPVGYCYGIEAKDLIETYLSLDRILDSLLLEPLFKLKFMLGALPSISTEVNQLDSSAFSEFQKSLLPIPQPAKPISKTTNRKQTTAPPKRKKKKKGKKRQVVKEETDLPIFNEKEIHSLVDKPICFEAEAGFFRLATQRLLCAAGNAKDNKKSHLVQAAWHLEKVNTLRRVVNSQDLHHKDFLNILTTITTHSSLAIEQLLDFHILNKNSQANLHIHNLKILYAQTGVQRDNPSIQKFYLGTFWARYPLEEFDEWRQSITHDRNEIPDLLEKIAFFASRREDISPEEFRKCCNLLLDDLERDIASLMPKTRQAAAEHFIQQCEPKDHFDPDGFNSLTERLASLITDLTLPRGKGLFKMKECLLSVEMLQRTLLNANRSQTVEEFTFWTTRSLYLMQESADLILHSLEAFKSKPLSVTHNILKIEEAVELDLSEFGKMMQGLSKKMKYPFTKKNDSSACELVDSMSSLNFHPQLFEEGSQMQASIYSFWKLPLQDISMPKIAYQLNSFISHWQSYMADKLNLFTN